MESWSLFMHNLIFILRKISKMECFLIIDYNRLTYTAVGLAKYGQ